MALQSMPCKLADAVPKIRARIFERRFELLAAPNARGGVECSERLFPRALFRRGGERTEKILAVLRCWPREPPVPEPSRQGVSPLGFPSSHALPAGIAAFAARQMPD